MLFFILISLIVGGYLLFHAQQQLQQYEEEIHQLNHEVEEFNRGLSITTYASLQELAEYKQRFKTTYDRILQVQRLPIAKPFESQFEKFCQYYHNLDKVWEARNRHFLANEMKNPLFSDIDGKALDNQQREAVIRDEQNQLVLAGAGSGKTLTIVAKVVYLIKHQKVQPENILLLTFTDNATKEMKHRLQKVFPNLFNIPRNSGTYDRITIKTFHSFGLDLLKQGTTQTVVLQTKQTEIFKEFFNTYVLTNNVLMDKLIQFYGKYLDVPAKPEDFATFGEYIESQRQLDLRTLRTLHQQYMSKLPKKGGAHRDVTTFKEERVKSQEEVAIANFLFLNEIDYEYESLYQGETNDAKRPYKPDFYLPQYGIYIEHFGVDEHGDAKWLTPADERRYKEGMAWKRRTHQLNNTPLIETYSYEFKNGTILDNLTKSLQAKGVVLQPITGDKVVELMSSISQTQSFSALIDLFLKFLSLYKGKGLGTKDIASLRQEMSSHPNPFMRTRNLLFLEIFESAYLYYEQSLNQSPHILTVDFDDMVNLATEYVKEEIVSVPYQYVVVDEYQDVSWSRFRLLEAIQQQTNCHLMAVGDDWQSIFRFAGSDLALFTMFQKILPHARCLKIEQTYRNSQQLLDIASQFVMKNSIQMKKELKSCKTMLYPVQIVQAQQKQDAFKYVLETLSRLQNSKTPKTVMVLLRNNFDFEQIKTGLNPIPQIPKAYSHPDYPTLTLLVTTVHASKGLEADEVILVNGDEGYSGFPSQKSDDSVLEYVLTRSDAYPFGEERRLFYVALTRTKGHCFILSTPGKESLFVKELMSDYPSLPVHRLGFTPTQAKSVICPSCKRGELKLRTHNHSPYVGCSYYPHCDFTTQDVTILTNPHRCPKCDSYLIRKRKRQNNTYFLGCLNYPSCGHKEELMETQS